MRASTLTGPNREKPILVVSIGHSRAFYAVFVPLEYISNIPPHSTYIIVILIVIRTFRREWATIELRLEGKTMKITNGDYYTL